MATRVIAIVAAVVVTGCSPRTESFVCSGAPSSSCGAGGTCEANGFCSFADSTCPSGRRFGDLGGPDSGQCVGDQLPPDASPPDVPPPDARVCFGAAPFTVCFMTPPTGTIDVSMATTFDTVTGTVTGTQLNCANPTSGGTGYCVIAADTININQSLRATGSMPLLLVAVNSIDVPATGTIDVASHRMGATDSVGAGANPTTGCTTANPPSSAGGNSGGGGGGSFIGGGGNGANGGGGSGGGHVSGNPLGTVLRGGCPGQNGAGTTPGKGGAGGGAVFLIAGSSITIGGTIHAGGEGGDGGTSNGDGGGGGGAGGLIGFDATSIMVTGTLIANGGGGGGGASQSGTNGGPGGDAATTNPAPGGGGGGASGGNGGAGSAGAAAGPGTTALDATGGGGGGGGGAGLIKGPPASLGTKLSPAATP